MSEANRSRTPSLAEVLKRALSGAVGDLRVALPGQVQAYDPATQLAQVQPLLQDVFLAEDDGPAEVVTLPVINNVPVIFPGAGGFRLTFPLAAGDTVLLVFSDRSLDRWLEKGGVVDPGFDHQHHLSDAIALPGLHDKAHPWSGAGTGGATMGKDGGLQVHFKAGEICLGEENPTDAVATANKVTAQLESLKAVLLAWKPVPNDGGAALSALLTALLEPQTGPAWPLSVASSVVKVSP